MQIIVTHDTAARPRVLQIGPLQLALGALALLLMLFMFSGAVYHFVFLTAAREG